MLHTLTSPSFIIPAIIIVLTNIYWYRRGYKEARNTFVAPKQEACQHNIWSCIVCDNGKDKIICDDCGETIAR